MSNENVILDENPNVDNQTYVTPENLRKDVPTLDQLPTNGVNGEGPELTRWQRWLEWVDKNAQPKIYKHKKFPLPKMPWSKSPMTEADWNEFDEWVKNRALPIEELPEPKPPKRKRVKLEQLLPRIEKLSVPKIKKERFVRKKDVFTFMPAIKVGQPSIKEKPRKIKQPKIRKCFPHPDIYSDFMRFMLIFKIPPSALTYKITNSILKLSIPRKYPPDPHCPLPIDEPIPSRIKMTYNQWLWHCRRLSYLAAPRTKLDPPIEKGFPRGNKKPIYLFESRCRELSTPRKYPPIYEKKLGVKKSALEAEASPRLIEISKPKFKVKKYKPKKQGTGVKKGALSYVASNRIEEISKPKKIPEPEKILRYKRKRRIFVDERCYL